MSKRHLLFLIIFLEGYVVLAAELLAIRTLIPFVGSGIEVVSIIIGAVLLPLAVGYWAGGRRAQQELGRARANGRRTLSLRALLQRNLIIALGILSIGLSYVLQEEFFAQLTKAGLTHRIAQTAVYAVLFLVYPTYLLAQTVPLVSNYFSRARLAEITGRMLFFSTAGSFFGSIVSTLLLMTFIGVNNTVTLTMLLLGILVLLVTPKQRMKYNGVTLFIVLLVWLFNSDALMQEMDGVADTPYSRIALLNMSDGEKILSINRSFSSKFSVDPEKRFPYVQFIEKYFINKLPTDKEHNILVLGAGGFVIGWDDKRNQYTFVDIDPALKEISEKKYLPEPLSPNKHFEATSARAYLTRTDKKFDLVIMDVYANLISMPAEAITDGFLRDVKKVMKPDGALIANIISNPAFSNKFSVRYYNTFASVFPTFNRQIIGDFDPWSPTQYANTLYIYYNKQSVNEDRGIYTDDKNTYSLDH